jgi:aerobic-type carbon monoxide dehydrogenase small subunit (CoxS/CutS family)
MRMTELLELRINGRTHNVAADPARSLLGVLRDDLDLIGTRYGCGEGQCGACTVLLDARPVRSCITPVGTVGSRTITTIEGLEKDGVLHPVQQAFVDANAAQCGYCTSGMIMSAVGLLNRESAPAADEIRRAMSGNICRCGVYSRIMTAIQQAARTTSRQGGEENGND